MTEESSVSPGPDQASVDRTSLLPESSVRLEMMRRVDGLLRTTKTMERGEAARAITDALLASFTVRAIASEARP